MIETVKKLCFTNSFWKLRHVSTYCVLIYIINRVVRALNSDWMKSKGISDIINWVVRALYADWLNVVVYHGYERTRIFTVLMTLVTSFKVCIQSVLCVASCIRTALGSGILIICHTPSGLIAYVYDYRSGVKFPLGTDLGSASFPSI